MSSLPPQPDDRARPPIPDPHQQFVPPPAAPVTTHSDATGGIIPYKNSSALIAYYLGVFSIIPCFLIGLAGFFLGIKGLKFARENPEAKGTVHAWIGIIAGGLFGFGYLLLTVLSVLLPILAQAS